MKGKGSSLGGTQSLSLQLQQVRLQEGDTRQDNVLLASCAPGQPTLQPEQKPI